MQWLPTNPVKQSKDFHSLGNVNFASILVSKDVFPQLHHFLHLPSIPKNSCRNLDSNWNNSLLNNWTFAVVTTSRIAWCVIANGEIARCITIRISKIISEF